MDNKETIKHDEAVKLAEVFHDTYETLAPAYGYETREDTKVFDPETKNGMLMIAVCKFILENNMLSQAPTVEEKCTCGHHPLCDIGCPARKPYKPIDIEATQEAAKKTPYYKEEHLDTPPVQNEWEKGCVFCDLANRAGVDILDIEPLNPVVEGHRIVFSRHHSKDFTDDIGITMRVMQRASEIAKEMRGDCNLITSKGKDATQSVFHLHVHIVPRKSGDNLLLPWSTQKEDDAYKSLLSKVRAETLEEVKKCVPKPMIGTAQMRDERDAYNQCREETLEAINKLN